MGSNKALFTFFESFDQNYFILSIFALSLYRKLKEFIYKFR